MSELSSTGVIGSVSIPDWLSKSMLERLDSKFW